MTENKNDKVEIIEPDMETAKLFQQTQTISDGSLSKARQFMDEMKQDYEGEISSELHDIKLKYSRYRMADDEERKEILSTLNRQVLKVKSNAGMFGFELLTQLCELLFELLDDGNSYDVDRPRVEKSIELYINTLYIVYRRGLSSNESEDAQRVINELRRLNKSLRPAKR